MTSSVSDSTAPAAPITGEALLELSEAMTDKPFAAFCRAAGYVKLNKKGVLRPDQDGLKSALLKAHGHSFAIGGPRGRTPDSIVRVGKSGGVQIAKTYVAQADAQTGDAFRISVSETGQIVLDPIDDATVVVPPTLPTALEERVPALAA